MEEISTVLMVIVYVVAYFTGMLFTFRWSKDWLKEKGRWPNSRKARIGIFLLNIIIWSPIWGFYVGRTLAEMTSETIKSICEKEDS